MCWWRVTVSSCRQTVALCYCLDIYISSLHVTLLSPGVTESNISWQSAKRADKLNFSCWQAQELQSIYWSPLQERTSGFGGNKSSTVRWTSSCCSCFGISKQTPKVERIFLFHISLASHCAEPELGSILGWHAAITDNYTNTDCLKIFNPITSSCSLDKLSFCILRSETGQEPGDLSLSCENKNEWGSKNPKPGNNGTFHLCACARVRMCSSGQCSTFTRFAKTICDCGGSDRLERNTHVQYVNDQGTKP